MSLIFFWGGTVVRAQAPKPQFDRLSLEDGLSQGTVFSIVQDHQGFMWFGTQSGLNKYDGYTIKVFRHDPNNPKSIANDNAGNLFIDHEGMIWIGTWGSGVMQLNPQTEVFTTYKPDPDQSGTLSSDRVQTIYEDHLNQIWVGTAGGGLNRFDRQTQTFTVYQHDPDDPESLSHNRVWRMAEDRMGFLWVATTEGLNRFDPKTEKFTRYYNEPDNLFSLSHSLIRTLYLDHAGVLWIGTEEGLNKFNPVDETFTRYYADRENPETLADNVINSILEDSYGNFWVGTSRGGLNQLERSTGKVTRYLNDPRDAQSLSYNDVRWLYEDNSGMLWIATRGGGVNKFRPNLENFFYYTYNPDDPNSLSSNDVRAVYVDEAEQLWIGTRGGGLNKYAEGRFTTYRNDPDDPQSLGYDDVFSIIEGENDTLWLGLAGGGLNQFDLKTEQFTRYRNNPDDVQTISNDNILVMLRDSLGRLWLGTKGGGLNRFDPKTKTFTRYQNNPDDPASLSNNDVFALLLDTRPTGGLWVGTYGGGVDYFDPKTETFTHYRHDPQNEHSLSNNDIYALYQAGSVLWIATANGGLNKLDLTTQEVKRFTEAEGLPSNVIYGILVDKAGDFWLSTSRGLSQFNPQTELFINYDTSDGLQNLGYNEEAYYQSAAGDLFFGGINGLLRFNPQQIRLNSRPPKTVLTGLTLAAQTLPASQVTDLTLTPNDSVVGLEFAALDYVNPTKNQYAYQLEGFDSDWVLAGSRRFATYTNLDAGQYLFRVKSANSMGQWDEQGVTLKITVLPPFWETWWFRLTIIILTLILAVSFYQVRVKRIEHEREKLEQLVTQRTTELWTTNQHLQLLNSRLQDELAIAREIQQSLLPPAQPQWSNLNVVCYSSSAHEVGGDFYAYHAFDDFPLSNLQAKHNRFALAVGDVSGKGMPAALLMAISLASFHSLIPHMDSPRTLLTQLNEAIRPYTRTRQQNCALCYVEVRLISSQLMQLHAMNAGCVPPIIWRKNGQLEWLEVGGFPLGTALSAPNRYYEATARLEVGDFVILTSDGVIEAMTDQKVIFGFERLEQIIRQGPVSSAEAMLLHLKNEIAQFVGQAEPHDDLTMVVIKV